MHRIWVDTEDLVLKNEALEGQLKQSQASITSSFGEMFAGFDRMKRETTAVVDECTKQIRMANVSFFEKYLLSVVPLERDPQDEQADCDLREHYDEN